MRAMRAIGTMAAAIALLGLPNASSAGPAPKDPTKYDCRQTVKTRTVLSKGKARKIYFVKECPHKDKMAAGQCETSWLWGMRCKS